MYTADLQEKEAYLRHILRRHPDELGLIMSPEGWVDTLELLHKANSKGHFITMDDLHEIMSETKTEYSFANGTALIRANYGHCLHLSLNDIVGVPSVPDGNLYHGTAEENEAEIMQTGILPRTRDHVFLTSDFSKAKEYGMRHGKPIVFEIDISECAASKLDLYHPCSHIWLASYIPGKCIYACYRDIRIAKG